MKPIAGSVVSSKPVSLPKAASILARFAASDTGAHQDVSAFLRRTSEAFDELARFHRDLGTRPERSGGGHGEEAGGRKKERKSKGEEVAVLATPDVEDNRRRKKKKQQQHKGEVGLQAARDGRLVEIEGDPSTSAGRRGGSIFYPRESESGTREKKRAAKKMEDGIGNVVEVEREKGSKIEVKWMKNEDLKEEEGVVENHSEQRRKKKRKKEEDVMEGSGGGVESHMERHRTKKRKKEEDVMEGIGDGVENHVKSRHKKKRKVGEES